MGYLGYAKKFEGIEVLKYLKEKTEVKVKLYYGEDDWLGYKDYISEMNSRELGVPVEILKGANHNIPNTFADKITEKMLADFSELKIIAD